MKILHQIIILITFSGFVTSCSMGIYQEADNLQNLGVFLFFVTWILSLGAKK